MTNQIYFVKARDTLFLAAQDTLDKLIADIIDLYSDDIKFALIEKEEELRKEQEFNKEMGIEEEEDLVEYIQSKSGRMEFIEKFIDESAGPIYLMERPEWMTEEEFNLEDMDERGPLLPQRLLEEGFTETEMNFPDYSRYIFPSCEEGLCEGIYKEIFKN